MEFWLLAITLLLTTLLVNALSFVSRIGTLFQLPGWVNLLIVLGVLAWFISDEY